MGVYGAMFYLHLVYFIFISSTVSCRNSVSVAVNLKSPCGFMPHPLPEQRVMPGEIISPYVFFFMNLPSSNMILISHDSYFPLGHRSSVQTPVLYTSIKPFYYHQRRRDLRTLFYNMTVHSIDIPMDCWEHVILGGTLKVAS